MPAISTRGKDPSESDLRYLKGIGPKRAQALENIGIRNLYDLFFYFPRRYEDRGVFTPIASLKPGEIVTVRGEILASGIKSRRFSKPMIFEAVIGDSSGMLPAVWFNQAYLKSKMQPGKQVILHGKADYYQNRIQITNPEHEILDENEASIHAGRITPVYPLTEGIFQRTLRAALHGLMESKLQSVITEYLPLDFRAEHRLLELGQAVKEMHFPASFEMLSLARRRIVFDEFFIFEVTLLNKIEKMRGKYRANAIDSGVESLSRFQSALPFQLTECQMNAAEAIRSDLAREVPMNRLLMGDVGSGKTVVAAYAMMIACKTGMQTAVLVPTEILAMQHYETLKRIGKSFNVDIKLLTASTPPAEREKITAYLRQGKISCVVGTHSLLQQDVEFSNLALVIIDEQHKFGVQQRSQLFDRSPRPHQLVMTATPIPRTLALTVFGDLDISSMKMLPAGRQAVKTYWIARHKQEQVLRHIRDKVNAGEQAYFIFPMIQETEKIDLLAATNEYEKLSKGLYKDLRVGLVHGKMPAEERDTVMKLFREGKIQVLVATSVIEVGVDNTNATVMGIENAERFGLSQLHQMRGRVGRGHKESECFLFGEPATEEGKKRLRILTKTQDGFLIAEEDLKLRGPGDFYGTRQSGMPLFRVAHPVFDEEILTEARTAAIKLLKEKQLNQRSWTDFKIFLDQMPIHY